VTHFGYTDRELHAEAVPLSRIAEQHGTPCFVYSHAALTTAWQAFDAAFKDRRHLVCYAVKANSNLAILNLFARLGSGFDIVSEGELQRVLAAGQSRRRCPDPSIHCNRAQAKQVRDRHFSPRSGRRARNSLSGRDPAGDLLAVMSAGAYGMSMSSNYNTRPRAVEVMVDAARSHVIRERETVDELMAREIIQP